MTFDEAVAAYAKPLLTSDLMQADPSGASIQALTEAFVLIKHLNEATDTRMKAIREVLLARIAEYGKDTPKGGRQIMVEGTSVRREARTAALPDEKGLKTLLTEYSVDFEQAFSKVVQVVLDASKLKALVDLGKIPEAKVEALKKTTWALRVIPSTELADRLQEAIVGKEPLPEVAPRPKRTAATGKRKG